MFLSQGRAGGCVSLCERCWRLLERGLETLRSLGTEGTPWSLSSPSAPYSAPHSITFIYPSPLFAGRPEMGKEEQEFLSTAPLRHSGAPSNPTRCQKIQGRPKVLLSQIYLSESITIASDLLINLPPPFSSVILLQLLFLPTIP